MKTSIDEATQSGVPIKGLSIGRFLAENILETAEALIKNKLKLYVQRGNKSQLNTNKISQPVTLGHSRQVHKLSQWEKQLLPLSR
jgi:hypothetical protein